MELWIKLILLYSCCFGACADFDGRWPRQMASSTGLCRYGVTIDCCWGWTRRSWGLCQPLCQHGCKYGECVSPDKCRCFPGYAGKACNQDLNECGLNPRPCKHRCMNTFGSYKCYCADGYMTMPDGTCRNARTCAMANCQYGCEVVKGEVRCQCPSPGLQLAPDGRTCLDVDECSSGTGVCPRFRKCVNTFGSYICKCYAGFELRYINGKFQCIDMDECSLGLHRCTSPSTCANTPGSYRCKCAGGFGGRGHLCEVIPKVIINSPRLRKVTSSTDPNITSTTEKSSLATKRISAAKMTAPPSGHGPVPPRPSSVPAHYPPVLTHPPSVPTLHQPAPKTEAATLENEIHEIPQKELAKEEIIHKKIPEKETPQKEIRQEETPLMETPQKQTPLMETPQKHRGDVHIPRNHGQDSVLDFDIELGNTAKELHVDSDAGFLSCTFDIGLCDWIRDGEGDMQWETRTDPTGGKYLTVPEIEGRRTGLGARLLLLPVALWNSGDLCLSFRHKLTGHHVGLLQLFIGTGRRGGPALWSRTGGLGWRSTQITLWGTGFDSVVLKGERRRGGSGEIAVDDISLRMGPCIEEHNVGML